MEARRPRRFRCERGFSLLWARGLAFVLVFLLVFQSVTRGFQSLPFQIWAFMCPTPVDQEKLCQLIVCVGIAPAARPGGGVVMSVNKTPPSRSTVDLDRVKVSSRTMTGSVGTG